MLILDDPVGTIDGYRSAKLPATEPGGPRPRAIRIALGGLRVEGLARLAPLLGGSQSYARHLFRLVPTKDGGEPLVEPRFVMGAVPLPWPMRTGRLALWLPDEFGDFSEWSVVGSVQDVKLQLLVGGVAQGQLTAALTVPVDDVPDGLVERLAPWVGKPLRVQLQIDIPAQAGLFDEATQELPA